MRTDDFDYVLPERLIAQVPTDRGASRMLVLHRVDGRVELRQFQDLPGYLHPGDVLVVNDSRVTARRLACTRESGHPAEALLLRPRGATQWEALVRPGKSIRPGARLLFVLRDGRAVPASVTGATPDGGRVLDFAERGIRDALAAEGVTPLPPYIHAGLADEERYQTVYSGPGGSAAAPTAGLHFTEEMLAALEAAGVGVARVTLHVSVDTFRPVRSEDAEHHVMHGEWCEVSEDAAWRVNSARGRIVAIGTTAVRVLESAAVAPHRVEPTCGETRLFIRPGYEFRAVDALLTNFHLPRSTLLMLVSAFAGRERVLAAYRQAIASEFRFYSFGDAMLIV